MPKNLVVLCDGTWNDEEKRAGNVPTNVSKLARALTDKTESDLLVQGDEPYLVHRKPYPRKDYSEQVVFYDRGVGTGGWWDKIYGGATGHGIEENIMQAYRFLVDNYDPGDQIYVFGFSRGAYTVRSLVGLIRNVGLAKRDLIQEKDERELKKFYRDCLTQYKSKRVSDRVNSDQSAEHRGKYSHPMRGVRDLVPDNDGDLVERRVLDRRTVMSIRFMGVWDTVGALGIPEVNGITRGLWWVEKYNNKHHKFHDTRLSKIVVTARHAVAIDEHRDVFDATLWQSKPGWTNSGQRWFSGAHSDVGGGYESDDDNGTLSYIAADWIVSEAQAAGMHVPREFINQLANKKRLGPQQSAAVTAKVHDPSKDKGFRRIKGIVRKMEQGVNDEQVDGSALKRQKVRDDYQPKNLESVTHLLKHHGTFAEITPPDVDNPAPAANNNP